MQQVLLPDQSTQNMRENREKGAWVKEKQQSDLY